MIVDCFTFFNELDMLEYRLTVVPADKFVLVEATKTFSGKDKELFYEKNKARYQKWADKIVHIIVDFPETGDAWARESFQRNAIDRGLKQLTLSESDTILISDVDEIPNPAILSKPYVGLYALRQHAYYYNLTCFTTNSWLFPRIMNWGTYRYSSPQLCRTGRVNGIIEDGGWHLSYFGDTEFIKTKLVSFSHTEYSGEQYTDPKHIEDSINNCKDLNCGRPFTRIPISENKHLPPNHELLILLFEYCRARQ
jgi:beta-1,4-mannosyl-glycoprotein beta-1,4-N-acetylglucosaminyltransferase